MGTGSAVSASLENTAFTLRPIKKPRPSAAVRQKCSLDELSHFKLKTHAHTKKRSFIVLIIAYGNGETFNCKVHIRYACGMNQSQMMDMLIVDGVKYNLHVPKDEKEFEGLVKEHFSEIFGVNSLYFDIKPELRSKAGIGSKPDGIVVLLDDLYVYVVEFELAGHPVHDHVIAQ